MPRRMSCSDPFHDSAERRALPGHQDVVAVRNDRAGTLADPPLKADGMICQACGTIANQEGLVRSNQAIKRKRDALVKLRALGLTDDDITGMGISLVDEDSVSSARVR